MRFDIAEEMRREATKEGSNRVSFATTRLFAYRVKNCSFDWIKNKIKNGFKFIFILKWKIKPVHKQWLWLIAHEILFGQEVLMLLHCWHEMRTRRLRCKVQHIERVRLTHHHLNSLLQAHCQLKKWIHLKVERELESALEETPHLVIPHQQLTRMLHQRLMVDGFECMWRNQNQIERISWATFLTFLLLPGNRDPTKCFSNALVI